MMPSEINFFKGHYICIYNRTCPSDNYFFHGNLFENIYFKNTKASPPPLKIEWWPPTEEIHTCEIVKIISDFI